MNIMSNQKYIEWSLRLGLAAMFGYSGVDLIWHPTGWHWAVRGLPLVLQDVINAIGINTYLQFQGVVELLFALVFLFWIWPKLTRFVALLAALEMLFILVFVGIDLTTFRDFGPLGAAVALFFLLQKEISNAPRTNKT